MLIPFFSTSIQIMELAILHWIFKLSNRDYIIKLIALTYTCMTILISEFVH